MRPGSNPFLADEALSFAPRTRFVLNVSSRMPRSLHQAPDIIFVDQAAPVGRDVEEKHAIPADRAVIDIHEFLGRLDLASSFCVIEPARPDGNVGLRRDTRSRALGLQDLIPAAEVLVRQVLGQERSVQREFLRARRRLRRDPRGRPGRRSIPSPGRIRIRSPPSGRRAP